MKAIGIDIGGTSLRIGMIDEKGDLTAFEKKQQDTILTGNSVQNLREFIETYIDRHQVNNQIAGLTVALPATLNKDKSVVLNAPNIKGFDGENVKDTLQEYFSFPVFLLKDVSALFYYDLERFNISDEGVIIACYVGTGIGNAICINGSLFDGNNGAAGELGHVPVWNLSEICNCGNPGCAEMLAGGKYLDRIQKSDFPDTAINQLFVKHAEHPLLKDFVRHLAMLIASEINILDPETVVLGGGVMSMQSFPSEELEKNIRIHARKPLPEKNLRFLYSDNPGENGVIGAGIHTWKNTKERNLFVMDKILCPSMMCANFANLGEEIRLLEKANADIFHIDIMDGSFVPNFGMGLQDTQFIVKHASKPVDVHLMIQKPNSYVRMFAEMGVSIIYIHPEADLHTPRTLQTIVDAGAKPGIALNPGTAVETIHPLLSLAEYVLVMTVNPGYAGQKYLPFVDDKIDKLVKLQSEYNFHIMIDGACSPAKIKELNQKGVEGFILGTSALFGKDRPYDEIMKELRG